MRAQSFKIEISVNEYLATLEHNCMHCSAVTAWASARPSYHSQRNTLAGRRPATLRLADRHRIVFIEVFVHFALVKQFSNISILNSLVDYAQTSDLVLPVVQTKF